MINSFSFLKAFSLILLFFSFALDFLFSYFYLNNFLITEEKEMVVLL